MQVDWLTVPSLCISYHVPSISRNQNQRNVIQCRIVITIPLAICQANENSCWVEKLSSSVRPSSGFWIEIDIAAS